MSGLQKKKKPAGFAVSTKPLFVTSNFKVEMFSNK